MKEFRSKAVRRVGCLTVGTCLVALCAAGPPGEKGAPLGNDRLPASDVPTSAGGPADGEMQQKSTLPHLSPAVASMWNVPVRSEAGTPERGPHRSPLLLAPAATPDAPPADSLRLLSSAQPLGP